MEYVEIYVDGACLVNPGPGSWAAVFVCKGKSKEVSGYVSEHTTNNRMELMAAIQGLSALKRGVTVATIFSDSQYLVNTMNEGWNRGANIDLWEEIDRLVIPHKKVVWVWQKGHAGSFYNERADLLCQIALKNRRGKELQ